MEFAHNKFIIIIIINILGQGFCPLKSKITQFLDGFHLKLFSDIFQNLRTYINQSILSIFVLFIIPVFFLFYAALKLFYRQPIR